MYFQCLCRAHVTIDHSRAIFDGLKKFLSTNVTYVIKFINKSKKAYLSFPRLAVLVSSLHAPTDRHNLSDRYIFKV